MDVDNLEKDNRVDLGVIYGLANATVLPYDFSKTCEDMKQKVEYLRKESGNIVDMECISANIDRLGKAVAALNEMKLKASELSEVRIRAFNDTLLRLSRAITNAFYTNAEKYDQDSYGRTILSKPLPLLFPTIKLLFQEKRRKRSLWICRVLCSGKNCMHHSNLRWRNRFTHRFC